MASQTPGAQPILSVKMDSAIVLSGLLATLKLGKGQNVFFLVREEGITFVVEDFRNVQASMLVPRALFQDFSYRLNEVIEFKVVLSALVECLNLFGPTDTRTMLELSLPASREKLVLTLTNGSVLTLVELRILDSDGTADLQFNALPILNKVIMRSDTLKEVLSELDWSNDAMVLLLSPDDPFFRISTVGPSASFQIDFPKDADVFEHFSCTQTQQTTYKLRFLQPCLKALAAASKTQVRVNQQGMLNLRHMVVVEHHQLNVFIDFFIACSDLDSDDEDV
mmetsp:Transcript_25953/g.65220  ORF Transcript_25953/g.65220 Transcript_25953/m.65220 type:complete len:280 (+) Transcript_25953:94-933(+)